MMEQGALDEIRRAYPVGPAALWARPSGAPERHACRARRRPAIAQAISINRA